MQTKPNINEAQNIKPIDTIVHFGAGKCSDLDDYLTLHPRQLLLVEADPQLAEDLQNRTTDCESVQVTRAAVAGKPGPATFHRFTLPEVNSLHRATGLLELFPGLKTVELLPVKTVSPAALLEPMQLQAEQENRLVIDLPGEELPVLQALRQAQQLYQFSRLILHCGCQPLYESGEPASRILEWLRNEGFDLVAEDDSVDPDRHCWTLRRNALQLRNQDLQRKVNSFKKERDAQTKLAVERQYQIGQLTHARNFQSKLAEERQMQMELLTKERDEKTKWASDLKAKLALVTRAGDEATKLEEKRQQQIDELTKANEELSKKTAKFRLQIQNRMQERYAQVELSAESQQNLEQFTKVRDEQPKLNADLTDQLEQVTRAKDDLSKQAVERKKVIDSLKQRLNKSSNQISEFQTKVQQLKQERDAQAKLAEERQPILDELTADNAQHLRDILELLNNQQNRIDDLGQRLKEQLNVSLNNSTRQIESFIGIQTYIHSGQLIPAMHGWPVSPDFAFYLINLIEERNYDVILEFGSGTSTVLIAKAKLWIMQRQAMRQLKLSETLEKLPRKITNHKKFLDTFPLMSPTFLDHIISNIKELQPHIITFEHNYQYFEETLAKLRKAGVEDIVELNHAPLHDHITCEGEHFLYYSCEERIAALANMLIDSKAKILLLVDGPPAATGKHARYPVLPIVFKYLAKHSFDLLLDDFNRSDEKKIVERWLNFLDKRSIAYKKRSLQFEKGAYLLSV